MFFYDFHLLIVDEEAPIRKAYLNILNGDYDCKVVATANNGEDAITKINENDINIVLTDVKMPLLDGIGLAKYIHENRPDIAVLFYRDILNLSMHVLQYNIMFHSIC